MATSAANLNIDFSTFPALPSNISVANAGTDQPTISFNNANRIILSSQIVTGPSTTTNYEYTFHLPANTTRTSIVFPQLPVSLADFLPSAFGGNFTLTMYNERGALPFEVWSSSLYFVGTGSTLALPPAATPAQMKALFTNKR